MNVSTLIERLRLSWGKITAWLKAVSRQMVVWLHNASHRVAGWAHSVSRSPATLAARERLQALTSGAPRAWLRRREVKQGLRIGLVALIIFFMWRVLAPHWPEVVHHHWQVNWPLMLVGFGLLIAQELSYGLIWQLALRRLGFALPWRICLRIYLAAEFVRYIPGNVWHVLARVTMAQRQGVPKVFGLASMTVELATKIAAAALLFALSLPWWPNLRQLGGTTAHLAGVAVTIVAVPLLVIGLHPRVLGWGLNRGLALLKKPPVELRLTYRDILTITAGWLASWAVAGLGFWCIVQAVTPTRLNFATVIIAAGIYALGWDIGFLSFITPSGLGFREGAVALLLALSGIVPDVALASIVAILAARLIPTLAEVFCVGGAYFSLPHSDQALRAPEPQSAP